MSQDEGKESGVTDTPFKAGETDEMVEALSWALDNLRALAVGRWKPDDPAWQDMARARALLPTPPAADDLTAARAEGWRAGRDAAVDWVMLYGERGMRLEDMREALLALVPSPPDAKPAPERSVTAQESALLSKALEMSSRPLPPAPERERLKGWANVYRGMIGGPHDTPEAAARGAGPNSSRIACIDLSQHHVGEGLEP